jgi:hypothetical protein
MGYSWTRRPATRSSRLAAATASRWRRFFKQHRDRLRRLVELRLDSVLRARLNASDVVQHAFLDIPRDLDADRSLIAIGPVPPGRGRDKRHALKA